MLEPQMAETAILIVISNVYSGLLNDIKQKSSWEIAHVMWKYSVETLTAIGGANADDIQF